MNKRTPSEIVLTTIGEGVKMSFFTVGALVLVTLLILGTLPPVLWIRNTVFLIMLVYALFGGFLAAYTWATLRVNGKGRIWMRREK